MKALHHFILHLPKEYRDTFVTESGFELYMDKRMSPDKLSVRTATVIATPALQDTVIKPGYEVMVDDTIVRHVIFKKVEQESAFVVDKKKGYYKIEPEMIVLYRENAESDWQAYGENLMVTKIMEQAENAVESTLIATLPKAPKPVKDRALILYPSVFMQDQGIKKGDEVVTHPDAGIPFYVGTETWYHLHNRHVKAVIEKG